MSEPSGDPRTETARIIEDIQDHNVQPRRHRLTDLLVVITGLCFSIVIALAFLVIIADRQTISSLQDELDLDSEQDLCWFWLTHYIDEARKGAESADRHLSILMARDIIDLAPPNQTTYQQAGGELVIAEAKYDAATYRRSNWLKDGRSLPCPRAPSPLVQPDSDTLSSVAEQMSIEVASTEASEPSQSSTTTETSSAQTTITTVTARTTPTITTVPSPITAEAANPIVDNPTRAVTTVLQEVEAVLESTPIVQDLLPLNPSN